MRRRSCICCGVSCVLEEREGSSVRRCLMMSQASLTGTLVKSDSTSKLTRVSVGLMVV